MAVAGLGDSLFEAYSLGLYLVLLQQIWPLMVVQLEFCYGLL